MGSSGSPLISIFIALFHKNIFNLYLFFFISTLFAIDQYPEWFLYPDTSLNIIVGYSNSESTSFFNAKQKYCTFSNCIIDGVLYQYNNNDKRINDYYYTFDETCLDSLDNKLILLSLFKTNIILNQDVAVYGLESATTVRSILINPLNISTPDWTSRTFWRDNKYYYSVGMYSSYYNENDAWKSAEEKAIFELMNSIAIKYYSININTLIGDHTVLESVDAIQLKFHLRNIKVIKRWPDVKLKQYYVLIRIPINDVSSPFITPKG